MNPLKKFFGTPSPPLPPQRCLVVDASALSCRAFWLAHHPDAAQRARGHDLRALVLGMLHSRACAGDLTRN